MRDTKRAGRMGLHPEYPLALRAATSTAQNAQAPAHPIVHSLLAANHHHAQDGCPNRAAKCHARTSKDLTAISRRAQGHGAETGDTLAPFGHHLAPTSAATRTTTCQHGRPFRDAGIPNLLQQYTADAGQDGVQRPAVKGAPASSSVRRPPRTPCAALAPLRLALPASPDPPPPPCRLRPTNPARSPILG